MTASNLVVPLVVWGARAPTHCIASVLMTPDMRRIVTACNDGQIVVWDVDVNAQVKGGGGGRVTGVRLNQYSMLS
jgi:WD40 repeat protein